MTRPVALVHAIALLLLVAAVRPAFADGLFPPGATLPDILALDTDLDAPRERDPYRLRGFGLPAVAYSPETSVAFALAGLMQWRARDGAPDATPSTVGIIGTYTLSRQWLAQLTASLNNRDELNRTDLKVGVGSWERSFFGIGNDAPASAEELFRRNFIEFDGRYERAVVARRAYVGVVARIERADIGDIEREGLLDTRPPLGMGTTWRNGLGLSVSYDTRDIRAFPMRGAYLSAQLLGYGPHLGSDYASANSTIDLRGYVSRRRHVGAFRALSEWNTPQTPFWALAALGGASTMRGMTERRYVDNNRWVLQSEYRTPFLWRFGAVAFASLGDVYSGLGDMQPSAPKWSAGGGIRIAIMRDEGLNLRLDYGASYGGSGFYLNFGEAF